MRLIVRASTTTHTHTTTDTNHNTYLHTYTHTYVIHECASLHCISSCGMQQIEIAGYLCHIPTEQCAKRQLHSGWCGSAEVASPPTGILIFISARNHTEQRLAVTRVIPPGHHSGVSRVNEPIARRLFRSRQNSTHDAFRDQSSVGPFSPARLVWLLICNVFDSLNVRFCSLNHETNRKSPRNIFADVSRVQKCGKHFSSFPWKASNISIFVLLAPSAIFQNVPILYKLTWP